jgi:ABC-type uncharacterized transport system permease subunit
MNTLAGLVAVFLYCIATLILARQLTRHEPPRAALILGAGTLALPLHLFCVHAAIYQTAGLNLGLFHVISLVGWLLAALTIAMSLYQPVISLALGAFPLAALGILLSLFVPAPYAPLTTLTRGDESHILLSILAYSVLMIAAAQALLIATQDRLLRQHKRSLFNALPPLQTMERILFDLIAVGFTLLTLAIATGFLTLHNIFAQHVVHKTVLTLISWLVFAVLLGGRHWLGWRGATAIRFTLWGFGLLLLGFYGSKLVLELILHRAL